MSIDIGRARQALQRAGAPSGGLLWPIGREGRVRVLLRRRLAVLDVKNAVVDLLFTGQKPLAGLRLSTLADVERAMGDREKRQTLCALLVSREVLEDGLRQKRGIELGKTLDEALTELVAEGVILRIAGSVVLMRSDVYLAVLSRPQPHYDVAELNRLVREGSTFLKSRARQHDSTTGGRQYRL